MNLAKQRDLALESRSSAERLIPLISSKSGAEDVSRTGLDFDDGWQRASWVKVNLSFERTTNPSFGYPVRARCCQTTDGARRL